MMFTFFRVLRFAFQNFARNFWLSIATMTVIIITLLLVNTIIVLNHIKTAALETVRQQIDISLDFKHTIPEADVRKIHRKLEEDARIASIAVVTPDENLERFKARYPDIGEKVLPVLDKNPLGYTLKLRTKRLDEYDVVLNVIQNDEMITQALDSANFNDYRLFTTKAADVTDKINAGAVGLAGIFVIIALIIIFNTIRVSVYTHREEIAIMRLVGATNGFIRAPYLFESLFYSVLATALTALIVFGILQILQPFVDRFLADVVSVDLFAYYTQQGVSLFGVQFIAVALLTMLSSSIAMRRYLRI